MESWLTLSMLTLASVSAYLREQSMLYIISNPSTYLPFGQADWSSFYASGAEILKNLEHLVDKYQLRPYIRLQHQLASAKWNESTGKWHITIRRSVASPPTRNVKATLNTPIDDGWEEIHDVVDVLFLGVGSLSRWNWPDIKGLETFSGEVIHSAQWNSTEHQNNWKDKKVAVIGVVWNLLLPHAQ